MKRDDALAVLGLPPTATHNEIKQAHHDLVRKWHPDRFGDDPGRRDDAERRFKSINEAFQVLQAERRRLEELAHPADVPIEPEVESPTPVPVPEPSGAATTVKYATHAHWTEQEGLPGKRRGRRTSGSQGILSLLSDSLGMRVLVFAGLAGTALLLRHELRPKEPPGDATIAAGTFASVAGDSLRHPVVSGDSSSHHHRLSTAHPAAAVAPTGGQERTAAKPRTALLIDHASGPSSTNPPVLTAAGQQAVDAACADAKQSGDDAAYSRCFEDRSSIESACLKSRLNEGNTGYNRCIGIQLALLRAAPDRPDLSQIESDERGMIQAACSAERSTEGPAAYNRCLTDQVFQLEAAPPRPDLTALTTEEREALTTSCAQASARDGAAAYRRCLAKQVSRPKGRE